MPALFKPTYHITGVINGGQGGAVAEGIITYARQTVGNGDGCDARLISERIRWDRGSSIRDDKFSLNLGAIYIQRSSARHNIVKPSNAAPTRYITGVINGNQSAATGKGGRAYTRHAAWNGDGGQITTTVESIPPYTSPSRDDDFFQRSGNIVGVIAITRRPKDVSEVRVA